MTVWAALTAGELERELAVAGTFAAAVLGVAIVGRWQDLLPWGIALLVAPYAASLLLRDGGVDGLTPLYAAALVLTAELCYWAVEHAPGAGGRPMVLRRVASLAVLVLATAGASSVVLAASQTGSGGGLALELLGLLAAAGALALVTWLAWQARLR